MPKIFEPTLRKNDPTLTMSFKVGLALGGGAARGLAHLGVIRYLLQSGIKIDVISGTSIGAIIAAMYASEGCIEEAIDKLSDYLDSPDFDKTRLELIKESALEPNSYFGTLKKYVRTGLFFAVSVRQSSFISEETFRENLKHVLPEGNIEDYPIKIGLVSMDLDKACEDVSTSGDIIQKVMASCAIPGIFPPIEIDGSRLVDGSWINPVPVSVARKLGANLVIAVDVAPEIETEEKILNGFDVTLKAAEGSRTSLKNLGLADADVVLNVGLNDMHWADFTQIEKCIEEGEKTARSSIELIKRKLFWSRIKTKLFF